MWVQLIPVIEMFYLIDSVPVPAKGPHWEHVEHWRDYHARNLSANGFSAQLSPYAPGSAFYRLPDLTYADLEKLIGLHCAAALEGSASWDEVGPLFGGYVLRIDGTNVLYPQCCSDLCDIESWRRIAEGTGSYLYSGHPSPIIAIDGQTATFDFSVEKQGEVFCPPPPCSSVSVPLAALADAVQGAELELNSFAARLEWLNVDRMLKIPDISAALIHGRQH
ncbi:hypothetical protein JVX91_21760 [Pseudomonas sp. PDNC002]|uniref:hypothetical protein n=1 Tax=Pseudomonas sp. PDNC002 TaxID=2811422 RepID=UPI0019627BAD|nr:hypothetical protein [Pseudomonas sp. PDNC002]QRY78198.1 hypothetical protein JVX91_21760 [Pseudomonas sp. PDNC002]